MTTSHRTILDLAVIFLLIIVIVMLGYTSTKIMNDGTECLSKPFVFGAEKLSENNGNSELLCQCSLLSNKGSPTLWFDSRQQWFDNLNGGGKLRN